jgi:hypothetical protein
MSAILVEIETSSAASFSKGTDTHWITQNRVLWNENHHKTEKCELVCEVSWVSELSTWRSFLRSQRWLEATL